MASTAVTILDQTASYLTAPVDAGTAMNSPNHSNALDLGDAIGLRLTIAVTAAEGRNGESGDAPGVSPDLLVALEHSSASDGPWTDLVAPLHFRSVESRRVLVGIADRYVRTRHSAARGRFKFSVTGTAHGG